MYGRIYIAFSDGTKGLSATNLKVYIPNSNIALDVIRDAAGPAPTAVSSIVAVAGISGKVNEGSYIIAVANVTTSGFVTPPGPKIAGVYTPTIYVASPGNYASGILTSDGTNPGNGDTVTIGSIVYTFKTALTSIATPNEILIGAASTNSLVNLSNALSGGGNPGVDYGIGTQNPGVTATAIGNTLNVSHSKVGLDGNNISTTKTSIHLSWGAATLTGGTNGNKISLSNIAVGPTGTVQRQILITKANLTELFFLPSDFGGVINDNTTTTATLDFNDITDLVSSADYLFDVLETIPAPLGLGEYHSRLTTFGENGNQSILRVSDAGNPETFNSIDGIIVISKDDGFICTNSVVLRDVMYVHKSLGVFAVQDNGNIPANWPVYPVDKSINTPIHGISEFFGLAGIRSTRDLYFCVDRSGIMIFNGSFVKPPLTYKINKIWQTLNFGHYEKVVLCVDEQNHKIYCAFPTGSNTDNDTLIVGDYTDCGPFNPYSVQQEIMKIKWSIYQYTPGGSFKKPTALGIIAVIPDTIPNVKFGSIDGGGKIWKIDSTVDQDDGSNYQSYIESALLFWQSGFVHFFTAVRLRITGSGNLEITIRGEDNILPTNLYTVAGSNSLVLASNSGQEILARFNWQNEKAKIKLNLASGKFIISKVSFYGKPIYALRPL